VLESAAVTRRLVHRRFLLSVPDSVGPPTFPRAPSAINQAGLSPEIWAGLLLFAELRDSLGDAREHAATARLLVGSRRFDVKVARSLPSAVITAVLFGALLPIACGSDSAPPNYVDPAGSGQGASSGAGAVGGAGGFSGSSAGGSINTDSGSGGAGGIRPDSGCASAEVTGRLDTANLLFVIDRSGSMNCNLPEHGQTTERCAAFPAKDFPNQPSKWELTRDALITAFGALEMNGNARVGINMFPIPNTNCWPWEPRDVPGEPIASVDVQNLDAAHSTGLETFLRGVMPGGQTPIAGATIIGYRYLQSRIVSGALNGNFFLVLMTDGAETCEVGALPELLKNPDGFVYNAGLLGIPTFVIGAPGSEEARGLLSEIAYIGGTARSAGCSHAPSGNVGDCHFDMTRSTNFAADLTAALNAINTTVLSCELEVPTGSNVDRSKVNIEINGTTIGKDDRSACGTANGWQYKAGDSTKIELCGSACATAKTPGATLKIVLGCTTIPA
jgi:hypothetical protein